MTLRVLLTVAVALAALEGGAAWRARARRTRGASAFVDTALLEPSQLARAHRIVVREKPRTKVVHSEEGFEVRRIVEADAPLRETVLTRRGQTWVVSSYHDLDADMEWLGRTMSDLSQGRLTRFLTSDPELMSDLGFDGTSIRFEDERGTVVREVELGRKDGGDGYQIVRVGGRDAFVAKHEAEILGDPLSWIVTRVFRFAPEDVQEMELPFLRGEPPLRLRRPERGAPLLPAERAPNAPLLSARVEELLTKLLAEQVLLAVPHDHRAARAATREIAARLRLALFDGRRYEVGYGIVPATEPPLSADVRNEDVVVLLVSGPNAEDITQRYAAKAALVYTRGGTLRRLPASRAALLAPRPAEDAP